MDTFPQQGKGFDRLPEWKPQATALGHAQKSRPASAGSSDTYDDDEEEEEEEEEEEGEEEYEEHEHNGGGGHSNRHEYKYEYKNERYGVSDTAGNLCCPQPVRHSKFLNMDRKTRVETLTRPKSVRNSWNIKEDESLLQVVIQKRSLLLNRKKSKPRSKFWHQISIFLKHDYNVDRNKRQCRERFNLLFWKAVRNNCTKENILHSMSSEELDGLLLECTDVFFIDEDNNIMLKDEKGINDVDDGHDKADEEHIENIDKNKLNLAPIFEITADLHFQLNQLEKKANMLYSIIDWRRIQTERFLHQRFKTPLTAFPSPSASTPSSSMMYRCPSAQPYMAPNHQFMDPRNFTSSTGGNMQARPDLSTMPYNQRGMMVHPSGIGIVPPTNDPDSPFIYGTNDPNCYDMSSKNGTPPHPSSGGSMP